MSASLHVLKGMETCSLGARETTDRPFETNDGGNRPQHFYAVRGQMASSLRTAIRGASCPCCGEFPSDQEARIERDGMQGTPDLCIYL